MSEKQKPKTTPKPPGTATNIYESPKDYSDIELTKRFTREMFGGAGGSGGLPDLGGGVGGPDKPKKTLNYTTDVACDPEHLKVALKMATDIWSRDLSKPQAGQKEWGEYIAPNQITVLAEGEPCALTPEIKYKSGEFIEMLLLIEHEPIHWSKSVWSHDSLENLSEDYQRVFRKEMIKNGLENYLGSDYRCGVIKLHIDTSQGPEEIQSELEKVKKALAIAIELFRKMLGNDTDIEYKFPNPKVPMQSDGESPDFMSPGTDRIKEKVKGLEVTDETLKIDDMGGNEELKKQLRRLISQYENPEFFSKRGVTLPRGILLYGPPGTGKTLAAKIFASEIGRKFYHVKASDIMSKWYGESEETLKGIFKHVEGPCIIFIDEIDSIGESREFASEPSRRVLTELLQNLDGMKSRRDVILLAATNRKESLDPALLRSGRFDRHIFIDKPDKEALKQILNIYIRKGREQSEVALFEENIDVERLADDAIGLVGADIEEVVRRSKEKIVYSSFETKTDDVITTQQLSDEIKKYRIEREAISKSEKRPIGFVKTK